MLMRTLVLNQAKNSAQNVAENLVFTAVVLTILVSAVVTVLVASLKALSEIVTVIIGCDVIAVITEQRFLIGVGILIVELPTVLTVRLTSIESLFVTVVDRVTKHLYSVLARVIHLTTAVITIVIDHVVIVLSLLQSKLVLAKPVPILLLVTQIIPSILTGQFLLAVRLVTIPVLPLAVVLIQSLSLDLLLLVPIPLLVSVRVLIISIGLLTVSVISILRIVLLLLSASLSLSLLLLL